MRCFLSCSFHKEDRQVREWFTQLLEAFPDTEVILAQAGIHPPLEEIRRAMETCQLACFIVTKRKGGVPSWILHEVTLAHELDLTMFAFVEKGIPNDRLGALPSYVTYQRFDRNALPADVPIYIHYIYNARVAALQGMGIRRQQLLSKIKKLKSEIALLEDLLRPRSFDDFGD